MNLKRVPFRVTIEISGIYVGTREEQMLDIDGELHSRGWDALENFNDNLVGHIYKGAVMVDTSKAFISEDRRDNP
jgi:hypothetical protein